MARYADVPNEMKMKSEDIEPTFGYMMGRWHAQAEYMKKTYGIDSLEYADALENLWDGVNCLQDLSSLCEDTVHCTLWVQSYSMKIARHIEREIGIDPILNKNCSPFRHNTNISSKK